MMRKKYLIQNNISNKTKKAEENRNAKVTVQYIQEQQLMQKPVVSNHRHMVQLAANAPEDLEIENVEYLEDNANVEEYIEEPSEKDVDEEEEEDNFYPNAILCLMDLYKTKYESLNTDKGSINAAQIWRDIAKAMQESYFEFNEKQIRVKYSQLREQYFGLQTKEDIENFYYFEQLHDIYKDSGRENIIKGISDSSDNSKHYKDEFLLQTERFDENEEDNLHDFKSEEIVHKEHEFIDMVEKELQAMEDGVQIEDIKDASKDRKYIKINEANKSIVFKEDQNEKASARIFKRSHSETEAFGEPIARRRKINELTQEDKDIDENFTSKSNTNFNLYHYNQQQERRHREKMSLLEKSLHIQERALEQQHQLLQELIKRLPS